MSTAATPLRFSVGEDEAGARLDVLLSAESGASRAQVQRWISDGLVTVGGASCKAGQRVAVGEIVEATPPEPVAASAAPEDIPLDVLFEDPDLIVLHKPAGLVVHPAPGHETGTLVNGLLHHCVDLAGIGDVLRPGIVHRLDRGTSGVMVVAKSARAHRSLSEQFHDHSIHRVYWTLVRSTPSADAGVVDQPIGRHPRDRKRMSVTTRSGRQARTRWSVRERFPNSRTSLLEIRPETGRTHQIRVHMAWAGMPVVGDPVYGRRRESPKAPGSRLGRPALHALELGFEHPESGESMQFRAPMPADLASLLETLRGREGRS